MRIQCKYCKANLTSQAILLLEKKIDKIKCKCGKFKK